MIGDRLALLYDESPEVATSAGRLLWSLVRRLRHPTTSVDHGPIHTDERYREEIHRRLR